MPARPRLLAVLPVLAVLAVGLFLSVVQVFNYPRLSPVDELSHLDYMFRSPTVLEQGDKVEQQAMRTQACRGVDVTVVERARTVGGKMREVVVDGARIDARSASRYGHHDFGTNAARLKGLLEEIEEQVEALEDKSDKAQKAEKKDKKGKPAKGGEPLRKAKRRVE